MSHTPIQTLGSVFSSCCLLAGDSFRVLVEEEGCSGLARMVWPAGCAWGHSSVVAQSSSSGFHPALFPTWREKGGVALNYSAAHVLIPKLIWTPGKSHWSLSLMKHLSQIMSSVLQQEEVACILLCGNGKALKAVKITRPRGREDCVNYFQRDLLSSLKPGIHVPAGL